MRCPSGKPNAASLGSWEEIEGRRLNCNPLKGTAVENIPPADKPRDWSDLIVFLAVLATGTVLIVLGHVTAGGLASVCAALIALYGAWRRFR